MADNLHSLIVPWTEPVDNACREILGIQLRNYDVLDVNYTSTYLAIMQVVRV